MDLFKIPNFIFIPLVVFLIQFTLITSKISSDYFQLEVTSNGSGLYLSSFQFKVPNSAKFSSNLFPSKPKVYEMTNTGFAILDNTQKIIWCWSFGNSSTVIKEEGSELHVSNIWLKPTINSNDIYAKEDWDISLIGTEFIWNIKRTFLTDLLLVMDRFPTMTFGTDYNSGQQIAGFLDSDILLNSTQGFAMMYSSPAPWFEVISLKLKENLRFSPLVVELRNDFSSGYFSFSKQQSDGTPPTFAFGIETINRTAQFIGQQIKAGYSVTQTWYLSYNENPDSISELVFNLPASEKDTEQLIQQFGLVHVMYMGFLFGNNPSSVPVLQEMAVFPMIQSIFSNSPETEMALKRELIFFAKSAIDSKGYVAPRWWMGGFYTASWGNFHDQVPHFILSVYYYLTITGDLNFFNQVQSSVDKVSHYMIQTLQMDKQGIPILPTSGLADGGLHTSNWFDIIEFGYKDALVGIYCIRAVQALMEIAQWTKQPDKFHYFQTIYKTSVAAYNSVFWHEEFGFYKDWIDSKGYERTYFYTDQNLLAIIFGIADPETQGKRILQNLDNYYDRLEKRFNVTRKQIWATPCNMIPVIALGDLVYNGSLANQYDYPSYENGGSFFHTTAFEILARAMLGQQNESFNVFKLLLNEGFKKNQLWGGLLGWTKGVLYSEPMNNALLILWGFFRAAFGINPMLNELQYKTNPFSALEGSSFQFAYLGKNMNCTIQSLKTSCVYNNN